MHAPTAGTNNTGSLTRTLPSQKVSQHDHSPTMAKVKFSTVNIRQFPIILSNNPSCHYGPSIELGWEYEDTEDEGQTIKVSQYESEREGKRRHTKAGNTSKLYLSQVRREAMLKEAGYTDKEVKSAIKDKNKARRQRSMSKLQCIAPRISASFEGSRREKKVGRAIRNMDRMKCNKDEERFYESRVIYRGWWLPFSAHYF